MIFNWSFYKPFIYNYLDFCNCILQQLGWNIDQLVINKHSLVKSLKVL